jgi:DNA polymerase III epsilon subunit-like protein
MTLPRIIAENRLAVFDTETTGLSIRTDEIVQMAVCQMDNGRPHLRVFCTICPSTLVKEGAFRKHGLSNEKLAFSPHFADIIDEMLAFIGDRTLLGWGIRKFDLPILNRQLAPRVLDRPFIDALLWNRRYEDGSHALDDAAHRHNITCNGRHDAFTDCKITWSVFCSMANRYEFGQLSLEEVTKQQETMR